ncbi:MAG: halocarboxylic acid dehydrogenase DehI family protein [Natronomonas sp.]
MDPTVQVFEADATPIQRGLYDDVRTTFRAPIVNSIWRTLVAHEPELTRYVWVQIKPVFETREFAAFTVAFRDRVLAAAGSDLPLYDPGDVELDPADFTELRGQLATFDVVAPRLAVLFCLLNRRLNEVPVGTDVEGAAATEPFPEWLDRDRGRPPSMLSQEAARDVVPDDLASSFGAMVPSIYRCLAQWPPYLEQATRDLRPVFESAAFEDVGTVAFDLAETYLDRIPYTPRVDPDGLVDAGADVVTVAELRDLLETFRAGGESILSLLHVYAATVGAEGEREGLVFG